VSTMANSSNLKWRHGNARVVDPDLCQVLDAAEVEDSETLFLVPAATQNTTWAALAIHKSGTLELVWEGRWVVRALKGLASGEVLFALDMGTTMNLRDAEERYAMLKPRVQAIVKLGGQHREFHSYSVAMLALLLIMEQRKGVASRWAGLLGVLPPLNAQFFDIGALDTDPVSHQD